MGHLVVTLLKNMTNSRDLDKNQAYMTYGILCLSSEICRSYH